jgi:hypothetical protein
MRRLNQEFRIAIRAREGTVGGESETVPADIESYASPDEAVRAGYDAMATIRQLCR